MLRFYFLQCLINENRTLKLILLVAMFFSFNTSHASKECVNKLVLLTQNKLPLDESIDTNCSIENGISIGGYALSSSKSIEIQTFNKTNTEQIDAVLQLYLDNDIEFIPKFFSGYIMLDIEHPVHPRNFFKHTNSEYWSELITSFKQRISTVREKYPKAKLILYGVIATSNLCARGLHDEKKIDALVMAHELGLFDNIDYAASVLYLRNSYQEEGLLRSNICTIENFKYISDSVNKRITSPILYLPLMSVQIYSKKSKYDRQFVLPEEIDGNFMQLVRQSKILLSMGYNILGIWTPDFSKKKSPVTNENSKNILFKLYSEVLSVELP